MSKQRKSLPGFLGEDPSLEHALALVQEYTRKLRTISRRIRDIHAKYLVEAQERLKEPPPRTETPIRHSPKQQEIWVEIVNGFQSQQNECKEYLRVLIPQAVKLAQHASQLIGHGTNQTIIKIELSLRVAELESAINTARSLAGSSLIFLTLG